jgi:hypothetical protein
MSDGVEVMRATSINNIGEYLGCSRQYIYQQIGDKLMFTHNKIIYQIIDRLA